MPSFKRPKSILVQMALSSSKYALKVQRLETILVQNASPKVQEWQSYGKFRKVTQNPHFSDKRAKGGPREIFRKSPEKYPLLERPKSTLAQAELYSSWNALKVQRLENILAQTAAPKVSEWASYGNYRKVTQDLHFQKKCKGETNRSFSKNAQKVALAWKSQQHSGANVIIL